MMIFVYNLSPSLDGPTSMIDEHRSRSSFEVSNSTLETHIDKTYIDTIF